MKYPVLIQLLLQKESSIQHLRLGFPPEQSQQLAMPEQCWHSKTSICASVSYRDGRRLTAIAPLLPTALLLARIEGWDPDVTTAKTYFIIMRFWCHNYKILSHKYKIFSCNYEIRCFFPFLNLVNAVRFYTSRAKTVTAWTDSLVLNNTVDRISSISSGTTPDAWPLRWTFSISSGRIFWKMSTYHPHQMFPV